MQQIWLQHLRVGLALAMGGAIVPFTPPAQAQIIFDGTLRPIAPNSAAAGQVAGANIAEVQGFSQGINLFHSFQQFSLPNGTVSFQSGANIQNIISRVTGGMESSINGTIQAGDVNFFLINPRGIIFSNDARLDVGRSFVAATSDSIAFDDGVTFSAVNTDTAPLLTINDNALPAQLTFGGSPGPITVNNVGFESPAPPPLAAGGLAVNPGQTLGLLGGNVSLDGGILQAPNGQIEIGGLAGAGTVELNFDNNVLGLNAFPDGVPRANVQITNQSVLDVTIADARGGGSVSIQAANIDIAGDSSVCAGLGASIICGGNPMPAGAATEPIGNISLNATGQVQILDGSRVENDVNPGANGNAGNVLINANSIILANGAIVSSSSFGTGEAGNILLSAPAIRIDNAFVSSELFGTGTGQNQFAGNLIDVLLGGSSEIFGSVLIFTDFLELSNGGQLRSNTFGTGNAGAVFVSGGNVLIRDEGAVLSGVADGADGTAGGIVMFVDNLQISGTDTGLTTSTFSAVNPGQNGAGLIFISANGDVLVEGNGSGIFSTVGPGIDQPGGAIGIVSNRLGINNGAAVSVDNEGLNEAGTIRITSGLVAVLNQSEISATTASGNGGDIEVESIFVFLDNSSNISTNAQAAGMGGNIDLTVQSEIIAFSTADSNIRANAVSGDAGRVTLGGVPALRNISISNVDTNPPNDITASSDFGVDGEVTGQVFELEQVRANPNLPEALVDPSRLIAQGCAVGDLQAAQNIGEFTVTGRGGLAPDPTQQVGTQTVLTDLAGLEIEPETTNPAPNSPDPENLDSENLDPENSGSSAAPSFSTDNDRQPHQGQGENTPISEHSSDSTEIPARVGPNTFRPAAVSTVEAKGWRYGPDGEIVLTAQANDTIAPPSSAFSGLSCNGF